MSLSPGTTLGAYSVTAKIGEGGMGEVYRARDTKLERDVALKVLPQAFTDDPDRLARFEREAKVLASLNHPNIGHIYGLEEAEGQKALVLELVEGPTLADRIAQGPIPVDEALPIAKQIAEALEAAHEAGVIHRDLKPANIKVRDDGTVKVLDFGLAKALDITPVGDPSESPTLTAAATQMGVIMGTAAYMSPEQARGKVVDKRADIWAFGAVLYEMLTGQRAFAGTDVTDTLAAVVRAEPEWPLLPDAISPSLRVFMQRCLEKDAKHRVGDVHDLRLALEGAFETTVSVKAEPTAVPQLQVWQRPVPAAITALLLLAIGGVAVWSLTRPAPPRVARFPIPLTAGQAFGNPNRIAVAISPDGSQIVYRTANGSLWLRPVDQLEAIQVPGTEEGAVGPFFSADGQSIGFFVAGQLKKVAVSGGAPVTLADLPDRASGASWGLDDMILYGLPDGIWQVPGASGTPELLIPINEGERFFGPQMLPGGEWVLLTMLSDQSSWDAAEIVVQSVTTGERMVLIDGGRDGRYLPTGHLVYGLNNVLFAVPFDVDARQVTGGPVPLVEGVAAAGAGRGAGAAQFGVSATGSLVYVPDTGTQRRSLVWVDRQGQEEPVGAEARDYQGLRLSPDGGRAAVAMNDDGNEDILIYDLARDIPTRLTFDAARDSFPVWSPNGERVAFTSYRDGGTNVFWKAADGTGEVERLTTSTGGTRPLSSSWSPDGTTLVLAEFHPETQFDIVALSMDDERASEPLLQTEFREVYPEVSSDGRWLAYQSNESGQQEVYVRPFPNVQAGKWLVSQDGGNWPVWAPDSSELFYRRLPDLAMMAASIDTEPTFRPGNPVVLFDAPNLLSAGGPRGFDIAPDGQRFLMIKVGDATSEDARPQINIVENWFQELLERVPVP